MQKRSLSSPNNIYRDKDGIIQSLKECAMEAIEKSGDIKEIILFGSIARGDYGLYSDADVLIIVNESKYRRYFDRIPEFLDYFLDSKVPVDIFPYTVDEVERMKKSGNALITRALQEGVVLVG